jgi:glutamate synthase domain-containing protein 1
MKNLTKVNNPHSDEKVFDACSIFGMMNLKGERFSAKDPMRAIANMHDRGKRLGGGFAAYGIYPAYKEEYALHIMSLTGTQKRRPPRLLTENST